MFGRKKKNIDAATLVEATELRHIAFIMDGNGRWASSKGLPREAGHREGAKNFKEVVRYCKKIGIKYVTVYAFSTENWKRPKREVDAIMNLLDGYITEAKTETDIAYRFIGSREGLPAEIASKIDFLEDMTVGREYRLNVALNYGGRAEIVTAVNKAIAEGLTELTEDDISKRIYTSDCPEPDLIVRTGGELRTSNFPMWQGAYSELFFSDKLWPSYSTEDVDLAIMSFSQRKRRFGGLDKNTKTK